MISLLGLKYRIIILETHAGVKDVKLFPEATLIYMSMNQRMSYNKKNNLILDCIEYGVSPHSFKFINTCQKSHQCHYNVIHDRRHAIRHVLASGDNTSRTYNMVITLL